MDMLSPTSIERLSRLVHLLRGTGPYKHRGPIPLENFDLTSWHVKRNECGTVACACGHAAKDIWFVNRGLTLYMYSETSSGEKFFEPKYNSFFGFLAISEFFKIPLYEAEYLFQVDSYEEFSATTPERVADRIENFIEEYS